MYGKIKTDKRFEKKLPIGIEDFKEMITEDFYYVDKTGFICDLLQNWGKVNLFTRPRRFGKSLNMSMLKYFFDTDTDRRIFDGLEIAGETGLCEAYMGKFPVIFISLKGMDAGSYEVAYDMAVQMVNAEAGRMQYLLDSDRLTQYDKERLIALLKSDMKEAVLCSSLKTLSELLCKHHGRKAILLIDEYDVPLEKAFEHGYYDKMAVFIRNFFAQGLKTNTSLQFAVLTGCMRISKESIFTGLNNLKVLTIADTRFDEYFGFTDRDVKKLLDDYGLSGSYGVMKDWYDGYQFGNAEVYCPWDVVNYCDYLRADSHAQPQNYWVNTSSNDVVRRFIEKADKGAAKKEIEKLVAGETVTKAVRGELTYRDMYDSIENLWSVLFATGYLTQRGIPKGKMYCLAIPNMEIREIYTEQIMELFRESVKKNGESVRGFCEALQNGDAEDVEKRLGEYLKKTISIRDTFVQKQMKENFYHGILLGLLGFQENWGISSNRESGDGYSDIIVEDDDAGLGIVIEVKYAQDGDLEKGCKEALEQIGEMQYEEALCDEGAERILRYGIACYKKRCRVKLGG